MSLNNSLNSYTLLPVNPVTFRKEVGNLILVESKLFKIFSYIVVKYPELLPAIAEIINEVRCLVGLVMREFTPSGIPVTEYGF